MGVGIGNLGNIVSDFTESVNQIFGGAKHGDADKGNDGGSIELFAPEVNGIAGILRPNWTGNTINPSAVRYGFAITNLDEIKGLKSGQAGKELFLDSYYLDIAPQAITQKEIFATAISATRKGVIVESEGVVFKDITISGTTGIFPGVRGGANNPTPNFSDFTKPPSPPAGVDPETGLSKASGKSVLSGYEEFLRLRQFFLRYAAEKVKADGNCYFIFINEKDNSVLIVEPLEFTMERSASSPLTYNYRIVLKAIGTLQQSLKGDPDPSALSFLEQIGNVAANVSATVQAGRAVINQSRRLVERFSQAIDQTFINPLRQLQFAMEDLRDGISTILSLPEVLYRNFTDTTLSIRENRTAISNALIAPQTTSDRTSTTAVSTSSASTPEQIATELVTNHFNTVTDVFDKLDNGIRIPVTRRFVEQLKDNLRELSNNLADFIKLGDPLFNQIQGRTVTNIPAPLKVATDDEILLLGAIENMLVALNESLATNNMFQADIETVVSKTSQIYKGVVNFQTPKKVKEVTIIRGDSLERIALRELGDASRWVDIVILNKLKAPYIADTSSSGVKKPGDTLLVGDG